MTPSPRHHRRPTRRALAGIALTGAMLASGGLGSSALAAAAPAGAGAAQPVPVHAVHPAEAVREAQAVHAVHAVHAAHASRAAHRRHARHAASHPHAVRNGAKARAAQARARAQAQARARALALGGSTAAGPGAVALSSVEARIFTLVNQARAARGIAPVRAAAGATDVARRWSAAQAQLAGISHNPRLVADLAAAGSGSWTWLAENVGVAPVGQADELFAAYMNSPHHRDNILAPEARFLGVGTVSATDADGLQASYNTMDFSDSYDAAYGPARTDSRS